MERITIIFNKALLVSNKTEVAEIIINIMLKCNIKSTCYIKIVTLIT